MFDINGWEFIIIVVLAAFLIGPERLPAYVSQLRDWVRQARGMAEGAKTTLREQMGPEFEDIDWKAYDPRQYDPRRIVREALTEEWKAAAPTGAAEASMPPPPPSPAVYDASRPTPYDSDAT